MSVLTPCKLTKPPYKGDLKKTMIRRLLELVDGAKPIIELWDAKTPAQFEWKKKWIGNAVSELEFAEKHKCQHEFWFRCKCGRPVCRKCEQEYEE